MATIAIQFTAGAQSHTEAKTISGADLNRLITAYRTLAGNPALTDIQVLEFLTFGTFGGWKQNVKRVEQAAAEAAAAAGVAEITLT